ncbi:nucleotidyltransferase domain-containing protein [Clostridium tagluense]|uniref:nucleotidyltransferase domain-containing protein n=1 Tax=Clostridium tagluense TaxID=360422 RepID=UPI001CF4BEE4|nr:nucleotidyltransferase family protein [Clostridium tagluense]MCB2300099.1 nucleotidyltransferase family protein [Clostridium tagluense]
MDNNTVCFISLLSAFINGREPQKKGDFSWEQVYKLARIHSVSGILYLMAKKFKEGHPPDIVLLDKMKKDFNSTLVKSVTQDDEIQLIIEKLNESKIHHAFMKGFVVKNYYPVKEMRTMGDIDFLIKPEDREKTHTLMLEMGYEVGNADENQHWDYTKGTVHIEIHTQIMYHNITNGVDYVSYFSDAWSHVKRKSKGYTYELTEEYHFLFLLVHMAKHFDSSGCGIRMIMDVATYLIYFKNKLDWDVINEEIEELGLVLFSKNIFILCKLWFGVEFPVELPKLDESFYKDLSHYILSAGTFGFYQRNRQVSTLRKEYKNDKGELIVLALLRAYRKICFPSYENMSKIKRYSFLKNRPFLLPVAWIYRAWRSISVKSKSSFGMLFDLAKSKEESKVQYEIISKLGL